MTESDKKKSRSMVMRLLTYRARSEKEVIDYLEKKGFTNPVIMATIAEMKEYGYIDDQKFAEDFINYRKNLGYGSLKIKYELIMKGIDKDIVNKIIDKRFTTDEDLGRISNLLSKRAALVEVIDEKWVIRQTLYLKRRGFQDNLIIKALKEHPVNDNNFSE